MPTRPTRKASQRERNTAAMIAHYLETLSPQRAKSTAVAIFYRFAENGMFGLSREAVREVRSYFVYRQVELLRAGLRLSQEEAIAYLIEATKESGTDFGIGDAPSERTAQRLFARGRKFVPSRKFMMEQRREMAELEMEERRENAKS